MQEMITAELSAHKDTIEKVIKTLKNDIENACELAVKTINTGNKIMFCGNGGSAADAQHLAAELSGRYKIERKGIAGLALTTDTSALTAIANDYAYEQVFVRQVEAIGKPGDLLIGISTTGNSKNITNAFKQAQEMGCTTLGLSGKGGGNFNGNCNVNIVIPSQDTPRIQEMHILIGHIICQALDDASEKD